MPVYVAPSLNHSSTRRKGMMIRELLSGLATLPMLASIALAAPPITLNDMQMDAVTAGFAVFNTGLRLRIAKYARG
jgi:hypothetical protein